MLSVSSISNDSHGTPFFSFFRLFTQTFLSLFAYTLLLLLLLLLWIIKFYVNARACASVRIVCVLLRALLFFFVLKMRERACVVYAQYYYVKQTDQNDGVRERASEQASKHNKHKQTVF